MDANANLIRSLSIYALDETVFVLIEQGNKHGLGHS